MRTLIHLTDLHVAADGEPVHSGPGPLRALDAVLTAVREASVEPAAIIISGDLADAGEAGSYAHVAAALAGVGCPVVCCSGNHDDRAAMRAAGLAPGTGDGPVDHVVWLGGLRVLVLDSSRPGLVRGELTDGQLAWAAGELATPAPEGTVVVLHHAPMPSPVGLDSTRLHRPERLVRVLGGTDVRIVLCGHSHHGSAAEVGGLMVWMGPALTSANDVLTPPDRHRTRTTIGATRIDLGAGWTAANPILFGGTVLHEVSLAETERLIADADGPPPN